jgi:hypothetical protein
MLWDITASDAHALDEYEGVAEGLYRQAIVQVIMPGTHREPAMLYLASDPEEGVPQRDYMATIVAAAIAAGLPAWYVGELRSWLPL